MRRLHFRGLSRVALWVFITVAVSSAQDPVGTIVPPGVIFEALVLNADLSTIAKPKYNSTTDLAVSPDKKILFVAQQTAKRIDLVDIATETVTDAVLLKDSR